MNKQKEKKKRSWISDIIFLAVVLVILLTPAGKPVKVWVNKLMAFAPSVKKEESRETLTDYNWQLVDGEGQLYNLEEAEDKVIFINIWATWCPPCIAEMPSVQALYDKYKDNPDIVFLFPTTDTPEVVHEFMQKHEYNLPTYYLHSTPPEQFKFTSYPTTLLIGKDGDIALRKKGSANWNSKKVHKEIDNLLRN